MVDQMGGAQLPPVLPVLNPLLAVVGESLTKSESASGASQTLSYANPAGPSQYLPSGSSDDAGNSSGYTYNGAGNQLTSNDAASAQAKVTYNTDGTVATATSPGNGPNSTTYTNTNKSDGRVLR